MLEDLHTRRGRVILAEALENAHPSGPDRQQVIARRGQLAHQRAGEQAFDRLNPAFGVPADRTDPIGHHDLAQRERALSLGVRVAVHDARQNDPNPVIWQPGQDYRMADALQAARHQPSRTRRGPERLGPER